jgi:hypothetical protein
VEVYREENETIDKRWKVVANGRVIQSSGPRLARARAALFPRSAVSRVLQLRTLPFWALVPPVMSLQSLSHTRLAVRRLALSSLRPCSPTRTPLEPGLLLSCRRCIPPPFAALFHYSVVAHSPSQPERAVVEPAPSISPEQPKKKPREFKAKQAAITMVCIFLSFFSPSFV